MEYRVTTPDDIEELCGQRSPYTFKALSFLFDGKLVGIAGWKLENGYHVIFSDFTPTEEIPSITVWRCAKIIVDFCMELGVPMYIVGGNFPMFEKLGMTKVSEGVYVCLPL